MGKLKLSQGDIDLVVLVSGGGTNLQSIIDSICTGNLDARIAAVISDQANAYGLTRARDAGIPAVIVKPESYSTQDEFENELTGIITAYEPDLVVLAGFMRILGRTLVEKFAGKIVNIHPSLLPKFKGLNTHQRVINAGETTHGATVHFVTAGLDSGPAIIQAKVDVGVDDTAATLQQKVLQQEHKIYPRAIQWIAEGKVRFKNSK